VPREVMGKFFSVEGSAAFEIWSERGKGTSDNTLSKRLCQIEKKALPKSNSKEIDVSWRGNKRRV